MSAMQPASHLPATGEVFLDARGGDRFLRVSWHADSGLVVLSMWREGVCVATFRLPVEEVPELVRVLRGGLSTAYVEARPHVRDLPDVSDLPHVPDAGDLAG